MNQALYRKYRSRSFDEVVGQDHVTKTLDKAIKSGRISHAYLFTGPRGVGKTTVARILARAVNSLPYEGEAAHLDVIEIDAASNRRIDEIRELRERVRIAPAAGKYKVYIIDEVHMLTREAFNALLKTLEEPPAHTIFVLATTEAHKLPDTIISRTQRFEFKPIAAVQAARHLKTIAQKEKIEITPGALNLLAEFGNGSFRDSISYLDQLSSSGSKITEDEVRSALGLPSAHHIDQLLGSIRRGDPKEVLNSVEAIKGQGVDAAAAAAALAKRLREGIIGGRSDANAPQLLKQLIEVPASSRPYDYLEVSLLETAGKYGVGTLANADLIPTRKRPNEPATAMTTAKSSILKISPKKITSERIAIEKWPEIIERAKSQATSLYTVLRLAKPVYEDEVLVLRFQFPLHQKKVNSAKNKALLADLIQEVTGIVVQIECVVDKSAFQLSAGNDLKSDISLNENRLHSINHVFGSAEVLES